jgi:uncharacterized membrane protein
MVSSAAVPRRVPSRLVQGLVLAVVLAAATGLRLHHLGTESLWLDEAFSVQIAKTDAHRIVVATTDDVHPPLYYLLLEAWLRVAGTSDASARLLSVLFSLGVIVAGWAMARRLAGPRVALFAAATLAVLPIQIEFAQEARMYALFTLLATLAMYGFTALIERWRAWPFVLFTLSTTALLYTHIYAVFILAAEAGVLAWLWWRDRQTASRALRPWGLGLGLAFIGFAWWIPIVVAQMQRTRDAFWIARPLWIAVLQPLYSYAYAVPLAVIAGREDDWVAWLYSYAYAMPLAVALTTLAVAGFVAIGRRRAAAALPIARPVLLAWFVAPIVLPFLWSEIATPIFLPKYTIAASVPFAIAVAVGIDVIPGRWWWRAAAAAVVVALAAASLAHYYGVRRKDDWRSAAAALQGAARPGDVVLFYPGYNEIAFDRYLTRHDLRERPLPLYTTTDADPVTVARLVKGSLGTAPRVWFVILRGEGLKAQMLAELRRWRHEASASQWTHVEVHLFTTAP